MRATNRLQKYLSRHAAKSAFASAVIGAILLLSGVEASANNELSLRAGPAFAGRSVDAVARQGAIIVAELSYARALFDPQRGLWLEASYIGAGSTARLFDTTPSAELSLFGAAVGARYLYRVAPWLVAHLRGSLGFTYARFSLGTSRLADPDDVADGDFAFLAQVLGGVQLLIPRRWMFEERDGGFTVGVSFEAGAMFTSPLRFSAQPGGDRAGVWPVYGTSLGQLSLSAAVLRFAFVFRF
ncbi:MAG: hypothetical protein H6707_15145 [Deltaproteobacteria bacterium]|nr:hypothetical protein [Deltaproteobacteria bacterium]